MSRSVGKKAPRREVLFWLEYVLWLLICLGLAAQTNAAQSNAAQENAAQGNSTQSEAARSDTSQRDAVQGGDLDSSAEPLRVLLLDYNLPIENDVLVSHLCVEPCRRDGNCPQDLIDQGVVYFSQDLLVFRPPFLGRNARFVVDIPNFRGIDLLSFSGHHASGFSGDYARGRFDTEALASSLEGLETDAHTFFTHPSLVLLQGCRTDVKSAFVGDPVEYVQHVMHETSVREDEFERLLAAIQQIGGVQEAYRDLFPNACLLGYGGTQAPGGRLEIFAQIHSWLRGLTADPEAGLALGLNALRGNAQALKALNRRIEKQCPNGWPCNLCDQDAATYRPLVEALQVFLRQERQRVHHLGLHRTPASAQRLEQHFEESSYYLNTSWSCSSAVPGSAPQWPDPVNESPFAKLFLELLFLDFENLSSTSRRQLRSELIHRLGRIQILPEDQAAIRDWLNDETKQQWLETFRQASLLHLSTFRQRDFFTFLANASLDDTLIKVFALETPSILRENAASGLHPGVGAEVFELALDDPSPRVRRAAATRIGPNLPSELLRKVAEDPDLDVRQAAERALFLATVSVLF